MFLIGPAAAALLLLHPATARIQQSDDRVTTARRLASLIQLAAQEYRLGVRGGRVVAKEEVDEARLFLVEARRTAALLPLGISRPTVLEVDQLQILLEHTGEPDSLDARTQRLAAALGQRLGVALEDVPARAPSPARGAAVYQAQCSSCHGLTGRGDGPAAVALQPPPPSLTDAALLRDRSPLDFYRRISIGVAGTAMPAFEARLSSEDRWAAAVYATLLRLPAPRGEVAPALLEFSTTSRMTDAQLMEAHPEGTDPASAEGQAWLAAVRSYHPSEGPGSESQAVFTTVRSQLDSAAALARSGDAARASGVAFDAYMTFEQVEPAVRARNPGLASDLEAAFAAFRTRAAGGATPAELAALQKQLAAGLENAERAISDRLSGTNLFVQSLIIMLREGLEAILLIGALMTFLAKTGAHHRKRDIHIGVGAAVGASLLTAVLIETLFQLRPAHREALEGATMIVAAAMLFYVSYWLLSKMEVAKWNKFVKGKVQDALSSGSALALAAVAFLAVYREGFETVLFYKALFVSGGPGTTVAPVLGGILLGGAGLVLVYLGISRYGVRIPLKPFFGVTSGFLYYMAFVFAGKGVAELQEGGLLSTTILPWAPRLPALGIYPTVESLSIQLVLVALLGFALVWTFLIEPRRLAVTSELVPESQPTVRPTPTAPAEVDLDFLRSLERMDADLAELRAEVERLKRRLQEGVKRS